MIDKDPQFQLVSLVNQARVPIIKCVINMIHFDLLFAAVDEPKKIYANLKAESDFFCKLSEQNQASLYGRIACDNILYSVS